MSRVFSILMILTSLCLMQIHGIPFWQHWAGLWSGIAFSLALEAAVLWNWYHRTLSVFKWIAVAVLIAGPWYQLSGSAVEKVYTAWTLQNKIERLDAEIKDIRATKTTAEANSRERTGWRGDIRQATEDLKTARAIRAGIQTEADALGAVWRPFMVAVMLAAIILIVMATQLAAMTMLRSRNVTPYRNCKTVTLRNSRTVTVPDGFDERVETVASEIRRRVPEFGSQAKLCAALGISRPANVTSVLKYKARKKAGESVLGVEVLEKVAGALGVVG